MGYPIGKDTATQPLIFLMISAGDYQSGLTGLAPAVLIRKPGGAAAAPAGAVTEVDPVNFPGSYQVAPNAADSSALGPLMLNARAAGAAVTDEVYQVVADDPMVATPAPSGGGGGGVTLSQLNAALASGITVLAPSGIDSINVESGVNMRQALSPILAACAGVIAGAGSGSMTIQAGGDPNTTRIAATTTLAGNRTAVTLHLPN